MDNNTVFEVEDYEHGVQYYSTHYNEWRMASTNHFNGWYPSEGSANNAIAQLRATRYGWKNETKYRRVKRPVGPIEEVN